MPLKHITFRKVYPSAGAKQPDTSKRSDKFGVNFAVPLFKGTMLDGLDSKVMRTAKLKLAGKILKSHGPKAMNHMLRRHFTS